MHIDFVDLIFLNRKHGAAPPPPPPPATTTTATPDNHPPAAAPAMAPREEVRPSPAAASDEAPAKCPVDHGAREAWLSQARAARQDQAQAPDSWPSPSTSATPSSPAASQSGSWGAALRSYIPFVSSSSSSSSAAGTPSPDQAKPSRSAEPALQTARSISSIPRAAQPSMPGPSSSSSSPSSPPSSQPQSHAQSACPANHEAETGADAATGNWIYPSERMFFEAMRRKGHAAEAADMKTVVPIHNAVNERAWREIREWEAPYTGEGKCDGPRLSSFAGDSTKMTPKARLNTLLGYAAPFDRHDWVVDRCGVRVDYVIDFYQGRQGPDGRPSFYLDVRPKLNSWEGARMRAARILGLV